jgi:hypothetical protein
MLYLLIINLLYYHVKMSMFQNAQTTNLTFVGKKWDIVWIVVALHVFQIVIGTIYNI